MAELIRPSGEWKLAFQRMAREWREHDNDRYHLALDDFDAYLTELCDKEDETFPLRRWVHSSELWLAEGGEIMACVRLRFRLNPELMLEGGHIGYDVRPLARRQGYGSLTLRLILPVARRRGLQRVLITADADNLASIRIIEKHGGALDGAVVSAESGKLVNRYWVDLGGRS